MEAVSAPRRHPFRLAGIVVGGVVLVVVLAAAVLFFWLRSYAPLSAVDAGSYAPGPGLAADVEPVTGSGGKTVFIPNYRKGRPFDTAFTLHNTGRFAVTVSGLASQPRRRDLNAGSLLATDSSAAGAEPSHLHAFRELRLDPGDTAILVVRWQLHCARSSGESYADTIPLRYRYLSIFRRTEQVRLPFAVTLRCSS